MSNEHLANFLRTGLEHDDLYSLDDGDIVAVLSDPSLAIILVHDDERIRAFKRRGWQLRKFRAQLLVAIDALVTQAGSAGKVDEYGAAVARLYAASLMEWSGGRKGDWLVGGGEISPSDRRAAVAGFGAGRFDAPQSVRPHRVARLLLSRDAAVEADPWLKAAMANAIRAALSMLHPTGQFAVNAQIRACALLALSALPEDDDDNKYRDELLSAAGITVTECERLREEIRGEAGVPSLFSTAGRDADLEALSRLRSFMGAVDRLGLVLSPVDVRFKMRLEAELGEISDPWVQWLYRTALSANVASARAMATLQAAGADRSRRSSVLAKLLDEAIIPQQDASAIFLAEMQALPSSLAVRVFRSIFEVVQLRQDHAAARELESTALAGWYVDARSRYVRDPRELLQLQDDRDLANYLMTALRSSTVPKALASLAGDLAQILEAADRSAAAALGRGWMFDLVKFCGRRMSDPESWDGGRRVLTPDDLRFIVELVAASNDDAKDSTRRSWFSVAMPPAREFRLADAAMHVGCLDASSFRARVQTAAESLRHETGLSNEQRALLEPLITSCVSHALGKGNEIAVNWRLLDAFRRLDAREMLQSTERSAIELPRKGFDGSVIGRRSALYWSVAGFVAVTSIAMTIVPGPPVPPVLSGAKSVPVSAVLRPRAMPLSLASPVGWQRLDKFVWARLVPSDEILRLVPGAVPSGGAAAPLQSRSPAAIAQEYVERLQLELDSYPDGVQWPSTEPGPVRLVKGVAVRLARRDEVQRWCKIAPQPAVPLTVGDVWTDEALSAAPSRMSEPFPRSPFGGLAVVVILEDRNAGK